MRKEDNILTTVNTKRVSKAANLTAIALANSLIFTSSSGWLVWFREERGARSLLSTVTSGFCASGLSVQSGDQPLVLRVLQSVVARTPEKGALCCVDAEVKERKVMGNI